MIKAGVYVHLPFCLKKCAYCDFLSHPPQTGEIKAYLEALEIEIKRFNVEGLTLFIGGGTPSVVPPALLVELIFKLNQAYGPFFEASIEINPATVDRDYLQALLFSGINRLSIGVQSFDDSTLQLMGRIHNSLEAKEAIYLAREVGFKNINIDLIYGYPGTDLNSLEKTLKTAVALPVEHISYYGLQLEPGSVLYQKNPTLIADAEFVKMYYLGLEIFEKNGFFQYEVSNFAKEGKECRHNLIYWYNEEYLGLGVGAVSRLGRLRFKNTSSTDGYITSLKNNLKIIVEREKLTDELLLKENIMLGLRLKKGLNPKQLFGRPLEEIYPSETAFLLKEGFLEKVGSNIRLTKKALPIMNTVISSFF